MERRGFIVIPMTELWGLPPAQYWLAGLPDTKDGTPHTLFKQAGDTLYVRILGRNTPCGGTPTAQTHFSNLGDGKPFWDSTTTLLQRATWPDPDSGQTLTINAPQVPEPLTAEELKNFDQDYARDEKQSGGAGYAYGQINPETKNLSIPTIVITFHCMAILTGRWCRKKTRDTTSQGRGRKRTG